MGAAAEFIRKATKQIKKAVSKRTLAGSKRKQQRQPRPSIARALQTPPRRTLSPLKLRSITPKRLSTPTHTLSSASGSPFRPPFPWDIYRYSSPTASSPVSSKRRTRLICTPKRVTEAVYDLKVIQKQNRSAVKAGHTRTAPSSASVATSRKSFNNATPLVRVDSAVKHYLLLMSSSSRSCIKCEVPLAAPLTLSFADNDHSPLKRHSRVGSDVEEELPASPSPSRLSRPSRIGTPPKLALTVPSTLQLDQSTSPPAFRLDSSISLSPCSSPQKGLHSEQQHDKLDSAEAYHASCSDQSHGSGPIGASLTVDSLLRELSTSS